MKNCRKGGCPARGRETCPSCEFWIPSRRSKYYRCLRYLESRITCDLPKGSCETCPFYCPPSEGAGRPNYTGVDWKNADEKREYLNGLAHNASEGDADAEGQSSQGGGPKGST